MEYFEQVYRERNLYVWDTYIGRDKKNIMESIWRKCSGKEKQETEKRKVKKMGEVVENNGVRRKEVGKYISESE